MLNLVHTLRAHKVTISELYEKKVVINCELSLILIVTTLRARAEEHHRM